MSSLALVNGRVLTDRGIEDGLAVLVEGGRHRRGDRRRRGHAARRRSARPAGRHPAAGLHRLPGQWRRRGAVQQLARRRSVAAHRCGAPQVRHHRFPADADQRRCRQACARRSTPPATRSPRACPACSASIWKARTSRRRARAPTTPASSAYRMRDEIELATALDNGITLITLAPERVGAETIRAFVARGAIVCAGHTAATYEEARAGMEAGISGFTHLYNAMSPLTGREPGAVGAALEDARQLVRRHRRWPARASGQPARGAGGQAARQGVPGHRCDAAGRRRRSQLRAVWRNHHRARWRGAQCRRRAGRLGAGHGHRRAQQRCDAGRATGRSRAHGLDLSGRIPRHRRSLRTHRAGLSRRPGGAGRHLQVVEPGSAGALRGMSRDLPTPEARQGR